MPHLFSMLCFDRCSEELARVLVDAHCSFIDTTGRFHLARPEEISGSDPVVGTFASVVLEHPGEEASRTSIDLSAGRERDLGANIGNPIELLHWLVARSEAVDFHPTVNAYIGSSDPDDILPFLPFHPAPGMGGPGVSSLVVVRLPGFEHGSRPTDHVAVAIGPIDFLLPSEALDAARMRR